MMLRSYLYPLLPFLLGLVLVGWLLLPPITAEKSSNKKIRYKINITLPTNVFSFNTTDDTYLCAVKRLDLAEEALYVDTFSLDFPKNVHHFLLYGCDAVSKSFLEKSYWFCHDQRLVCTGRKQIPLAINLSENSGGKTSFPSNAAYGIGRLFRINYLLLELHVMPMQQIGIGSRIFEDKAIGIVAEATINKPKYLAGMLVMAGVGFRIPPGREKFSININCKPKITQSLEPYGYWVHTHNIGQVVSGYIVDKNTGNFKELARWSHHLPQPVKIDRNANISIKPGNYLAGKCTYNSSSKKKFVNWGAHRILNEMCNLFVFYSTSSSNPDDLSISCVNEQSKEISKHFPNNSDIIPKTNIHFPTLCVLYAKFGIQTCPFN